MTISALAGTSRIIRAALYEFDSASVEKAGEQELFDAGGRGAVAE
jgi:hypothetical protein